MKPNINFAHWQEIDIRLGTILSANNPDWSNKLIELKVDFGPEGEKTIFTGLKQWYSPEIFVGKQGLFIINLEPRQMGPAVSEGMFISLEPASEDGNSAPAVLLFDDVSPAGTPAC